MLDIRLFRSDLDGVLAATANRGGDTEMVTAAAALDADARELGAERDELRRQVNELSKQVGQLYRDGETARAEDLKAESKTLGEREKELDIKAEEVALELREALLRIDNVPAADCPIGEGEADNVVLRTENFDPESYGAHNRVPHWDFAVDRGLLDVERAVKLSGAMFVMYRGAGAALARALVQLGLDRNADAYEEIRPPTLVLTETMISAGHLPKFEEDAYRLERDGLWAIPTAEVPLTSLGRGEVFDEADLPTRMMAHTSCFRREAGSAGRDTRGLLRVHEFDKVELLAYATPDQAAGLHEEILGRAEALIVDLGLAHRIVDICTGDLGNASARTWDIEVYAPGADQWLEVSSVSWYTDYQARRADLRYRPTDAKGTRVCHTLNGSALAVPRVWAALVETHRQPDGSIAVPEVLRGYLGGREVL
jgi:seryl-tRNA synthetase